MSASPAGLAAALSRAGARIAMELDINPEWVQFDVARRPGGPLRAAIRGQQRPANQFLAGWARDFIAVRGLYRVLVLGGGERAVGGLDVLEEAAVHPEVLGAGLEPVPDA